MSKLVMLTAFALGVAMAHQAAACDWQREAAQAPVVVADCTGSGCATKEPIRESADCSGAGCAQPDRDVAKIAPDEGPAVSMPNKLAGE